MRGGGQVPNGVGSLSPSAISPSKHRHGKHSVAHHLGKTGWVAWRKTAAHALTESLQAVLPLSYLCSNTNMQTRAAIQRCSLSAPKSFFCLVFEGF